jgi:hypothetical protein
LENLQKPAFYVGINGIRHDGNGIPHYCFQIFQSPAKQCAKNLPQFAGKTDVLLLHMACRTPAILSGPYVCLAITSKQRVSLPLSS